MTSFFLVLFCFATNPSEAVAEKVTKGVLGFVRPQVKYEENSESWRDLKFKREEREGKCIQSHRQLRSPGCASSPRSNKRKLCSLLSEQPKTQGLVGPLGTLSISRRVEIFIEFFWLLVRWSYPGLVLQQERCLG